MLSNFNYLFCLVETFKPSMWEVCVPLFFDTNCHLLNTIYIHFLKYLSYFHRNVTSHHVQKLEFNVMDSLSVKLERQVRNWLLIDWFILMVIDGYWFNGRLVGFRIGWLISGRLIDRSIILMSNTTQLSLRRILSLQYYYLSIILNIHRLVHQVMILYWYRSFCCQVKDPFLDWKLFEIMWNYLFYLKNLYACADPNTQLM